MKTKSKCCSFPMAMLYLLLIGLAYLIEIAVIQAYLPYITWGIK